MANDFTKTRQQQLQSDLTSPGKLKGRRGVVRLLIFLGLQCSKKALQFLLPNAHATCDLCVLSLKNACIDFINAQFLTSMT